MKKTIIVIPARMDSKRFPGKPLAKINDKSMLMHVCEKAIKSKVGEVVVACCDEVIKKELKRNNISFIMTKKNHKSGTDRVHEAYKALSKFKKYDIVINLQSDIPDIHPKNIQVLNTIMLNQKSSIATLVTKIEDEKNIHNKNIVKAVLANGENSNFRAIYFSRLPIPMNSKKYYEHIGIYAYTTSILQKFVKLKYSLLESAENLEQLRALENNINIDVGIIKRAPFSIDTPEDLRKFKKNNIENE